MPRRGFCGAPGFRSVISRPSATTWSPGSPPLRLQPRFSVGRPRRGRICLRRRHLARWEPSLDPTFVRVRRRDRRRREPSSGNLSLLTRCAQPRFPGVQSGRVAGFGNLSPLRSLAVGLRGWADTDCRLWAIEMSKRKLVPAPHRGACDCARSQTGQTACWRLIEGTGLTGRKSPGAEWATARRWF